VIQATEIYYIILGVLTLAGAVIGYVKTKELTCLVGGLLAGLVLIAAGVLLVCEQTNLVKIGLILGLLATAVLSGRFIPKVMLNRAAPEVIVMAVLSGVGMILTLIAFGR